MIEMLFYNTLYAFLEGNLEATRMYFSFLKEESKGRNIQALLTTSQLKKLKDIRSSIETGCIHTKQFIDQDIFIEEKIEEISHLRQNDLVRRIHQEAYNDLYSLIGSPITLYNIEHPCDQYGKVDMVYRDKEVMYPLEVKVKEGRHDLIGQIEKYIRHFMFKLHYKLYMGVRGITVCRSYEGHVLEELKKINVLPLIYYFSGNRVRIRVP